VALLISPTIFSPAQLAQILTETIPADVPTGSKYVVVGGLDAEGVKVVAGFTFDRGWQFRGAYRHDWSGTDTVGAQVIWAGR
jgi:hypothetical protein